jgi:hypothetical protein
MITGARRATANLSLPRERLDVIRCFNKPDPGPTVQHRSAFLEALRRRRAVADSPLLGHDERLAVLNTCRDVNKAVFLEYFEDRDLALDSGDLAGHAGDVRAPVDTERRRAGLLFAQSQARP